MDGQSLGFLRALAPFRTAGVEEPHLIKPYFRFPTQVAGLTGANKTVALIALQRNNARFDVCTLKQYFNAVRTELPPRINVEFI